jgi:lysozyme
MNRQAVKGILLAASTLVGIASYEGYRSEAYIPVPGDVPTIDFGRTQGVKMGDKSNPIRGLKLLEKELDTVYVAGVKRCVKVPLHQHEFAAYVSLTYNVGVARFCNAAKPGKPPNIIDLINSERYAEACARIDAFKKSGGVVYPGLVKRRAEERAICEGKYAD